MQIREVPGAVARVGAGVLAGVMCAALVVGGVSPVWAGEEGPGAPPVVELGSFSVGDGLEGVVNEADGSFGVTIPVGGLSVSWDSRVGVDRFGFGPGWGFGLATVSVLGGVRVFPSSGGVFEAADSVPSGLLGYAGADVVFRQVPGGVLEARADGVVGARGYSFELHELGGVVTYFNEAGDPVASVTATGDRNDWTWVEGAEHRLASVVSVDGVVTELDWSDPAEIVVRPGVNVPAENGGAGAWRARLADGRVDEVADPVGGRSRVGYDRSGRVVRVVSGSGAVTRVEWRSDADGASRVDRVGVADQGGVELSARSWRQVEGVLPSGWPAVDPVGAGVAVGGERSVEVSDGKTRVVSWFDGWSRLTDKRVSVSTSAGERVIQEQQLSYPEGEPVGVGDPTLQPVSAEVRSQNADGGVRAGTETYEYDGLGRMTRRVSADGTVLERTYDPEVPEGRRLPVGLPVVERSTATDGSVTATETELDVTRSLPVLVVQVMQTPGTDPVVVGRTEYTVAEGVVVEQRAYPVGDATAAAAVTRWDETVDLGRGVREVVETVAPGTDLAGSASSVASLLHGGALTATDVLGNTSTGSFDAAGRPVEASDASGRTVSTTYRTWAEHGIDAVTVTGPDGVSVTEVRDVLGRMVQKHDNLDTDGVAVRGVVRVFETHAFPEPGVEEHTDAWGATTRVEHDVHGRAVRVTLPNGLVRVTDYDEVNATVTSGSTPTGRLADAERVETSRMDLAGRVTATEGTRADGIPVPTTSTVYDGFGRAVEAGTGVTMSTVDFDAMGNPATTRVHPVNPAGADDPMVVRRRFDGFGASLEKTVSAAGQERSGGSRELDVLGRTVLETDQVDATTRFVYTPDGLPQQVIVSTGQQRTSTYDPVTRQLTEVRVEVAGQSVATGFAYDETTGRVTGVFDPADRAATEVSTAYDGFGNVRSVRYPAARAGQPGATVAYEYDRHGRKTATIDIAGNRSVYDYAKDGFLTEVVQTDAAGEEVSRVGYTPDEYGRVRLVTRGNGLTTAYAFTSAGQVQAETTTAADGTVQAARDYEYDPASGNLTVRVDRTAREASADPMVTRREYTYDHLDRLTSSTTRDGGTADAAVIQTVGYDLTVSGRVGRETTIAGASRDVVVREFTYAPTGALEAIGTTGPDGTTQLATQTYDAAGNLTRSVHGTEYEWDAVNREIAQTHADGTRIETSYWADGSRKALDTDAGSTVFHWDGTSLLNDTHVTTASGRPGGVASYLVGSSRHARTIAASGASDAAETSYYGTDRHGNVTSLTDQAGAITATYDYSDYGTVAASPRFGLPVAHLPGAVGQLEYNPFQYALEYTHADGTQFLRARTYDPTVMSFTSKDSEALHDLYGYVNANPIMLIDPAGRSATIDGFALGLNLFSIAGGLWMAFSAMSGIGVGVGLTVLGVIATGVGLADAAFTAVETHAMVTETEFTSTEVALMAGLVLAGAGLLLGVMQPWSERGLSSIPKVIAAGGEALSAPTPPLRTLTDVPKQTVQTGTPFAVPASLTWRPVAVGYMTPAPVGPRAAVLLGNGIDPKDEWRAIDILEEAMTEVRLAKFQIPHGGLEKRVFEKIHDPLDDLGMIISRRNIARLSHEVIGASAGNAPDAALVRKVGRMNDAIDVANERLRGLIRDTKNVPGAERLHESLRVVRALADSHLKKF